LSKDAAVRSNVASSKSHFGEAICQISLLNPRRFWLYPSRPRSVAK
jgi:hypothetical protein